MEEITKDITTEQLERINLIDRAPMDRLALCNTPEGEIPDHYSYRGQSWCIGVLIDKEIQDIQGIEPGFLIRSHYGYQQGGWQWLSFVNLTQHNSYLIPEHCGGSLVKVVRWLQFEHPRSPRLFIFDTEEELMRWGFNTCRNDINPSKSDSSLAERTLTLGEL